MREENIAHRVVYSLKTDLNIEQSFFAKRLGQLPRSRGTTNLIPFQKIGSSNLPNTPLFGYGNEIVPLLIGQHLAVLQINGLALFQQLIASAFHFGQVNGFLSVGINSMAQLLGIVSHPLCPIKNELKGFVGDASLATAKQLADKSSVTLFRDFSKETKVVLE